MPSLWTEIAKLLNSSYQITLQKTKQQQQQKFLKLMDNEVATVQIPSSTEEFQINQKSTVIDMRKKPNLTNAEINLLNLGFNFALPYPDMSNQLIQNMYAIEAKMGVLKTHETLANYVRNGVTKIITQHWKPNMVYIEWKPWIKNAIKSLKQRHNVIIGKADKNNCVVIMDKDEYNSKMHNMVNTGPYNPITHDPTDDYTSKLVAVVESLVKKEQLEEEHGKALIPNNPKCPRMYGSPKTHKEDCPLRPIVDYRSSPTYSIVHLYDSEDVNNETSIHSCEFKRIRFPSEKDKNETWIQKDFIGRWKFVHKCTY